jgi:predicted PurR-regulated permease PerM
MAIREPDGFHLKKNHPRVIRIEPSPSTIITLLLIISSLWMLNRLLPVILVLVAALIIVGTINPAVQWLEERRIRRGLTPVLFT